MSVRGMGPKGDLIIVSPDPAVQRTIADGLKNDGFRIVHALSAEDGRAAARSACAEMAVIDASLAGALDYAVQLRKANPAMGFLMVLGEEETDLAVEAARQGAYDFITRPLDLRKASLRIHVALERHSRVTEERAYTVALEDRILQRTEEVMVHRDRIKTQFVNTIRALEKALQMKNVYTEGHSRRVAEKTVEMARAMGVHRDELRAIELGALFHDIGKIGIRDDVLNKPGPLTPAEYEHMKTHPLVAEQIILPIEELRPIVDIVKHEHERWDGGGYPDGVSSEQIPLGARLIAVADAWDSMVYDRVYRRAMEPEAALLELERHAGTQFDPKLVGVFCALEREKRSAACPSASRA